MDCATKALVGFTHKIIDIVREQILKSSAKVVDSKIHSQEEKKHASVWKKREHVVEKCVTDSLSPS